MRYRIAMGMLAAAGMLTLNPDARANGIVVTNTALWNADVPNNFTYVSFNVSWSNSWRTATNWDAAWVFVKFQAPGSNKWQHATLSTNNGDHIPAAGSVVNATADGKGAFVFRADTATGNVNFTQMRLKWNYGQDGYTNWPKGAAINVAVHAIEMVYIPQGQFYLGSGGTTDAYHFYQYTDGSQSTNPFPVSSEAAITVGTAPGNLNYLGSGDQGGPLSVAFPKGYNAFYCMKYEISQGQYADFLNKLTGTQWTNRFPNQNGNNRHTISGPCTNVSASAPDRACNYFYWWGGCAYAAWAALRPMTELEFEKACRGPAIPVPNEYAWGAASITPLTNYAGADGSGTETALPVTANCVYNNNAPSVPGPARCGIFATPTSSRQAAGAGYYGVMELSGNLWELCITAGTGRGRNFLGTHGSGVLDANGNATNSDWGAASGLLPSSHGKRGGDWSYWAICPLISDRSFATYEPNDWGQRDGFRAVRMAP